MRVPNGILVSIAVTGCVTAFGGSGFAFGQDVPPVKIPKISEEVCPVTELRVSETSYAAVRKPPGQGPFPAVLFLHGGLGQAGMDRLRPSPLNEAVRRSPV